MNIKQQNPDGTWSDAQSIPFYFGLLPFLWRRLTGWRDSEGRKAHFIGWD